MLDIKKMLANIEKGIERFLCLFYARYFFVSFLGHEKGNFKSKKKIRIEARLHLLWFIFSAKGYFEIQREVLPCRIHMACLRTCHYTHLIMF